MSLYALPPDDVLGTIGKALSERVLPAVESDSARVELHAVLEMVENLRTRLAWDRDRLAAAVERTDRLAAELGAGRGPAEGGDISVEGLRSRRKAVAAALARVYDNGGDPRPVAEAVAEFTAADVSDQVSRALLRGLPD
ncbi:hypothetical protein AB0O86_34620 [Streptomyces hirsutus]|uniref:hypothetical protein n=1 Tax=Streptomyces hirsutus TaxID=35620 RepID=UPI003446433C